MKNKKEYFNSLEELIIFLKNDKYETYIDYVQDGLIYYYMTIKDVKYIVRYDSYQKNSLKIYYNKFLTSKTIFKTESEEVCLDIICYLDRYIKIRNKKISNFIKNDK